MTLPTGYGAHLSDDFAEYQFVLKHGDELAAVGQSIRLPE